MTTATSELEYTILWTSSSNNQNIIVEIDKTVLERFKNYSQNLESEVSLEDYINSWEINNSDNISKGFSSINELISSMNT